MVTSLPVVHESVPTHDNTMFTDWSRCPWLYHLRHIRGMSPRGKSVALEYGTLIHIGLARWYLTKDARQALEAVEAAEYTDPLDDFRTKARAMRKVAEYIEHYADEAAWWGPHGIVINENAFDLEDDQGFRYGGRMDLAVDWHGIWVMDHKTSAIKLDDGRYKAQFNQHPQPVGYSWAGQHLLAGEPLKGYIINRIVTHKVPKPAAIQMQRFPFIIDQATINEWREARIRDYTAIYVARDTDTFPRNRYNCTDKYGKCPAFDICHVPEASRERYIAEDWEHSPWDWSMDT
jgi:hypothetical protein